MFGARRRGRLNVLSQARAKFSIFRELLDQHYSALKTLSAFEENHRKGPAPDALTVWNEFVVIQQEVGGLIDRMIALGGNDYKTLHAQLRNIVHTIEGLLPSSPRPERTFFTVSLDSVGREHANSFGTKAANLGEMRFRMKAPVPDGFAISAWAYNHFVEANKIQDRINRLLANVRISRYSDLAAVSDDIREMVNFRSVPDDLADAILRSFDALSARCGGTGFALRSSAIGEDTSTTFAGQYVTYLNVKRDNLLDRYRDILASKFTPSAIYYLLRHSLAEMNPAMGVVCMEMVDSAASGVVYTADPTRPGESRIVINSIYGLGSYLVDGIITPDVFVLSRPGGDILSREIANKQLKLVLNPEGGVSETDVPMAEQKSQSVSDETLRLIADYALKVEGHYGNPQDIEWAIDSTGDLYFLQARPLKLTKPGAKVEIPSDVRPSILLEGGTTVCGGGGAGAVFHLKGTSDLGTVPDGCVLVAQNPSPRLVSVMHRISALVTAVGGTASHLATLAREVSLPTVVGMPKASELHQGHLVTVDAGRGVIYDGSHPEWISKAESADGPDSSPDVEAVRQMVETITHLSVIHPGDPAFKAENCRSLHDIIRFIHQKSMDEIFSGLKGTSHKDDIGLKLKTKIPLVVNLIYLDRDFNADNTRWIADDAVQAPPMQAFWDGVNEEGWPSRPIPADVKGFLAVVGANVKEGHTPEFSENSYAFLSEEFMLLSLRMGYHFSTIEAMATSELSKNYVRMQFKLGGAPLERRVRRIWLITEILRRVGFESSTEGDFLDSISAYQEKDAIFEKLKLLGRVTVLTKQLDMSLSSDARAQWYLQEFLKKLGIE
jgi:pyruvate,water dikinase